MMSLSLIKARLPTSHKFKKKKLHFEVYNIYYCLVIKDCFNDYEIEDVLENDFLNKSQ